MNTAHWILIAMVAVLIVTGLSSVVLYALVLRLLRHRHPETWKELGAPTLIASNSMRNASRFWMFNLRRRYKRLGDASIERLFRWMNFFSIVYGVVFASIVVLFLSALVAT